MFIYRPSKGNCWGHAIRPRDTLKGRRALHRFFETFFEEFNPEWDKTNEFKIRSAIALTLSWRTSVLPRVERAAEFLAPEGQEWQKVRFHLMETSGLGNRISFPLGLQFPLSVTEPTSYEFLRQFSAEAPFKMSYKNFQVGVIGKNGKLAWRKPDANIASRLHEAIV